jgi:YidC/Oxa1 family membrane protein insertase
VQVPASLPESPPVVDAELSEMGMSLVDSAVNQLTAIAQVGDLKLIGLASPYTPVGWIQQLLELNFVTFGLPWWGTIAVTTIAIRLLVLPISIKAQRSMAKLANIRPLIEPVQEDMARAKRMGDMAGVQISGQKLQKIFKEHNVNPLHSIGLTLVQAPIFLSAFLALRKMAEANVPGFEDGMLVNNEGGISWFTNLCAADPYYILPILSSVSMVASLEANSEMNKNQSSTTKNVVRFISVAAIPLFGHLPAVTIE